MFKMSVGEQTPQGAFQDVFYARKQQKAWSLSSFYWLSVQLCLSRWMTFVSDSLGFVQVAELHRPVQCQQVHPNFISLNNSLLFETLFVNNIWQ